MICAAAGLVLAAAMFISARSFPDRAAAASRYVFFLVAVLSVLSLSLLFLGARKEGDARPIRWIKSSRPFWATLGGSIVYIGLMNYIGFFPGSAIYVIFLGYVLGFRNPLWILTGTSGLLLFVYFVFVRFLAVPVPSGLWGG